MGKCSKCFYEEDFLVKYTDLNEVWALCSICNRAFDCRSELMREFMKEDFGGFPVDKVTKNMINARIRRATGKSPWKQENS